MARRYKDMVINVDPKEILSAILAMGPSGNSVSDANKREIQIELAALILRMGYHKIQDMIFNYFEVKKRSELAEQHPFAEALLTELFGEMIWKDPNEKSQV